MKIKYIILYITTGVLLVSSGILFSCTIVPASLDSQRPRSTDGGGSLSDICSNRDSCQDSCDFMFRKSAARSFCSNSTMEDVSRLEEVFDALSSSTINKNTLQEIVPADLETFLETGIDGWRDIIVGNRAEGQAGSVVRKAYTSRDAKNVLEWIAETPDVTDAILNQDEDMEIPLELFIRLSFDNDGDSNFPSDKRKARFCSREGSSGDCKNSSGNNGNYVQWEDTSTSHKLILQGDNNPANENGENRRSINLEDSLQYFEFIMGFVGIPEGRTGNSDVQLHFDRDSFLRYANGKDNDSALELAHLTLSYFCERMTDEGSEDAKVKQCMQAAYCSIRFAQGNAKYSQIFFSSNSATNPTDLSTNPSFDAVFSNIIDRHPELFGDTTGEQFCDPDRLSEDDQAEKLF